VRTPFNSYSYPKVNFLRKQPHFLQVALISNDEYLPEYLCFSHECRLLRTWVCRKAGFCASFAILAKCFQFLSSAILFQFNLVLASRIARIGFGFFERINKRLQRIGIGNRYALIDMPIFGANYQHLAKAGCLLPVQH